MVTFLTGCTMRRSPDTAISSGQQSRQSGQLRFDPTLYLVINPQQCIHCSPVEIARQAVLGGVTAIQIRNKTFDFEHFLRLASPLSDELSGYKVPIFVNDRVDFAAACAIDGVHLGQDDLPVSRARQILGDHALIGLTVRSVYEARRAALTRINYVSIGGVYPTHSKTDAGNSIGLNLLREICQIIRKRDAQMPIVAISGINQSNIESVIRTGVDGVAVVSAICESQDPLNAARSLRKLIDQAKQKTKWKKS